MPLGSFGSYHRTAGHLDPVITHEQTFLQNGSFFVPDDVRYISIVCVGAGGGGAGTEEGGGGGYGGDLRWIRRLKVTPGERLNITVGQGGVGGTTVGTAGGFTRVTRHSDSTVLLEAAGGSYGSNEDDATTPKPARRSQNGTSTTISLPNVGGGLGGRGGWEELSAQAGGGGGAAGYAGNGGDGADADEAAWYIANISSTYKGNAAPGLPGTGGAAGGGGAGGDYRSEAAAGGGGGVGLLGQGVSGQGGAAGSPGVRGGAGSGGIGGGNEKAGALYGGGGGGLDGSNTVPGGNGAQGAVRIIWGYQRGYPRNNTRVIPKFPAGFSISQPVTVNFTTPGTYSWVVPEGVRRINALAIGAGGGASTGNTELAFAAGGGGGGALAYGNNISVTPGETLSVVVGAGGLGHSISGGTNIFAGAGGTSKIARSSTDLIVAGGGGGGQNGYSQDLLTFAGGAGGTASGTALTAGYSGGKGGSATSPDDNDDARFGGAGGGGAAGYFGDGGDGAMACDPTGFTGVRSSSTVTIGTGSKTFVVPLIGDYRVGDSVRVYRNTDPNRFVEGAITSITSVSGGFSVVINATTTGGSSTYTSWRFRSTAVGVGRSPAANSGAAGGGGAGGEEYTPGAGGGGVGLAGAGITGTGGTVSSGGTGGSGGGTGGFGKTVANHNGGGYGGGAGAGADRANNSVVYTTNGAQGAVSIVYGKDDYFPFAQ